MIFDEIRRACARVAASANHVQIDHDRLVDYAATLWPSNSEATEADPARERFAGDEQGAAFVISLDAINFGSGYFPYVRKRPRMSGYHTIATCWHDAARARGGITAEWLRSLSASDCRVLFEQVGSSKLADALMTHFSIALRDLGRLVISDFDGSFLALIEAAGNKASELVLILDRLAYFHDVHAYREFSVPLYKRAQIAAFDLASAFDRTGPGRFDDVAELTMFADNLVPHVLRIDGVLRFSPELVERIERVDDIASGSEPEVEIRAVALHAVELLREAVAQRGGSLSSGEIDNVLWHRGAAPRYKAVPRHRTRCVFY